MEALASDISLEKEFIYLADIVSGFSMHPMHRDFQSQNIFLRGEKLFILDFQGARTGHFLYDVASLLKDPYVNMDVEMEESILKGYFEFLKSMVFFEKSYDEFIYQYNLVALQRLMQALGAYGFLGLKKGKRQFLQYIDPALSLLNRTIEGVDGFPRILEIVREAAEKASGLAPCDFATYWND